MSVFNTITCAAQEIKGGWIQYESLSSNTSSHTTTFKVTLYNYNNAPSYNQISNVLFGFWDATTGADLHINFRYNVRTAKSTIVNSFSPCPNSDSVNNFSQIITHTETVDLPDNHPGGIIITKSFFGRDSGIVNIPIPRGSSILHKAIIPGIINGVNYGTNTSPFIKPFDDISICKGSAFNIPISASDRDGDSLSYGFGDALEGVFSPTTCPPDIPVQYASPFSGMQPMGNGVTINPATGLISGTAPGLPGGYVITVNVKEWRKGILINTNRKECFIKVVNCGFSPALLLSSYKACNFFPIEFSVPRTCPDIKHYFWDFGVPGISSDTSDIDKPSFSYPAPGVYTLKLRVTNDDGFIDSATAPVNVTNFLTVDLPATIGVCKTDTFTLHPISDGLEYAWTESGNGATLNNYNIKNPVALPVANATTYQVTAKWGACTGTGSTTVFTSPYPKVKVSADTFICFKGSVPLSGTITAARFSWSPTFNLLNANTLHPIAAPITSTEYILSVNDTFFCRKTVSDTVFVKVIEPFPVDAGSDKTVSLNQPFMLNATGDATMLKYTWQPAKYMTNNMVRDPVATITGASPFIIPFTVKASTIEGCSATDEVLVKVYAIGPDILVPTAFTPNTDKRNDVLKPILIGIDKLDYFKIYNRFGELIFATSDNDRGWDGTVKGVQQNAGVYVFTAQGKDLNGKTISKNGTVVLVR